ncbi:MAG TPA: catalase family peroxidase [Rhodanobacteraceae bacterium]
MFLLGESARTDAQRQIRPLLQRSECACRSTLLLDAFPRLSMESAMRMFDDMQRAPMRAASVRLLAATLALATAVSVGAEPPKQAAPAETPLSMVNALHTAFGEHHARAVHTKGVMLEGEFAPDPSARELTKESIFAGSTLPIVARFSLFAGVPDLPDNADAASPAGFGIKIKAPDGDDFDIECNQHNNFIVATFDEFAVFLRALGATRADTPHPTPVEQFLSTHPIAVEFLKSRTYPESYAEAKYFGINSLKFTNAKGHSAFVRYELVPQAGERYLTPEERKARSATYLQDEIAQRVRSQPIVFDWYAQIADKGDKIEDPSIAWPQSRRRVKLGTFTLDKVPQDLAAADKGLLFLPGQTHPGVEAADPMLVMRNTAYPISFGQRQ